MESKQQMKRFTEMYGVGSSKYVVSFHDGIKTHKDGSEFYDIAIFKSKVRKNAFIKELTDKGFTPRYW